MVPRESARMGGPDPGRDPPWYPYGGRFPGGNRVRPYGRTLGPGGPDLQIRTDTESLVPWYGSHREPGGSHREPCGTLRGGRYLRYRTVPGWALWYHGGTYGPTVGGTLRGTRNGYASVRTTRSVWPLPGPPEQASGVGPYGGPT